VARIAAAQRYRGFGVAGRNFIRQCLLFQSWSRNSIDGLIIGFRATLRRWIARRGALRLRKLDVCSLLLASGSEKIGQDSPGGFSDGDRRWRSILRFDRLTDVGYPSEDLFGLSESFVNRGNSEVLIHVVLRRSAGGMRSSQSSLRVKEAGIAGCLALPFWCFPDFMPIDELHRDAGAPVSVTDDHNVPEYTDAGALVSYGAPRRENYRRSARYVKRILDGAHPAELPVEQPTEIEFSINLKTAKVLGVQVSDAMLARANRVIE
jgi:hypothetical protein